MDPALAGRALIRPRRDDSLFGDVIRGLASRPKSIPARWLWDERGLMLHQRLADSPEHYLERAERSLVLAHRAEIAARIGPRARVIELTPLDPLRSAGLLEALDAPREYVPVATSRAREEALASAVRHARAGLTVAARPGEPGAGDPFWLCPLERVEGSRVVVWVSATHFSSVEPHDATAGLAWAARLAGADGLVLVGADSKKPKQVLEAAYRDRRGAAAALYRNVLVRVNREVGATFDVTRFTYRAPYDPIRGRVEMRLVSDLAQRAKVGGHEIELARGEWIVSGHAHKHDPAEVVALARRAGLVRLGSWIDPAGQVSLHLLAPRGGSHARA